MTLDLTPEQLIWRTERVPQPPQYSTSTQQDQMKLAARFAALSVQSDDLPALQEETCRVAAEGLGVSFAKLLVYQPEDRIFLVEDGVGWRKGVVGTARMETDAGTAAGYAWHTGQSIISNDLISAQQFRIPSLLSEHGIVRTVNVVVPGDAGAAFGVLEVESPEPGQFTAANVDFLTILAHLLAAAITRMAAEFRSDQRAKQLMLNNEIAFRELHHRVRNDLQVIHSAISRAARGSAESGAGAAFDRVGRRVMALAGLYDHLLGKGGADRLDMGAYLELLCQKNAIAADLPSRSITLRSETDPVIMPLSHAVKVGVAVNELIANAVEHAFPDDRAGQIVVRLSAPRPGGDDSATVSITDDGCGFRGLRAGSAGLSFVEQLAQQAGGVLERKDGGGTQWIIRLPSASAFA